MKTIFISALLTSLWFAPSLAQAQGVLVSKPSAKVSSDVSVRIQEMIQQYVQSYMFQHLLKSSGEIVTRVSQQGQLKLLPDFNYLASHQIVVQMFQQERTRTMIQDAYRKILDMAQEAQEKKTPSYEIQRQIAERIREEFEGLTNDPLYRRIVEEVLNLAYQDQTRRLATRRMQSLVAQQAMAREVVRQNFAALAGQLQEYFNQRANALKGEYNRYLDNRGQLSEEQRLEYENAFVQYQQQLEQEYQQSLQIFR